MYGRAIASPHTADEVIQNATDEIAAPTFGWLAMTREILLLRPGNDNNYFTGKPR
ncbi:MAG: hypothetical protein ACE5HX_09220 [bacterium]